VPRGRRRRRSSRSRDLRPHGTATILLVEDEAVRACGRALVSRGYKVGRPPGIEALEVMGGGGKIDLVVSAW
jgi:hypothetical protein